MKTQIIPILSGNRIYLPKVVTDFLGLSEGDYLMLKCNEDRKGLILCKPDMFERLDLDFKELDDDFRDMYKSMRRK